MHSSMSFPLDESFFIHPVGERATDVRTEGGAPALAVADNRKLSAYIELVLLKHVKAHPGTSPHPDKIKKR